ncbi:hypothetical protein ACFX2B_033596 [Malus domestica]
MPNGEEGTIEALNGLTFFMVDVLLCCTSLVSGKRETAALLLSPIRPAFKNPADADLTQNGSQFTFFLTAHVATFGQLVGFSSSDTEAEVYRNAESLLSAAFAEWEVILCTTTSLDQTFIMYFF